MKAAQRGSLAAKAAAVETGRGATIAPPRVTCLALPVKTLIVGKWSLLEDDRQRHDCGGSLLVNPGYLPLTAYLLGGDAEPNGGSKRLWVVAAVTDLIHHDKQRGATLRERLDAGLDDRGGELSLLLRGELAHRGEVLLELVAVVA